MVSNNLTAEFYYAERKYICGIRGTEETKELWIKNAEGQILTVKKGQKIGYIHSQNKKAEIDVSASASNSKFYKIVKCAVKALDATAQESLLRRKDEILEDQKRVIDAKNEQIKTLREQIDILTLKINQLTTKQQAEFKLLQDRLEANQTEINRRETHISDLRQQIDKFSNRFDANKQRGKIVKHLGQKVWESLSEPSQINLVEAIINYKMIQARGILDDYSEAGLRLAYVIETEIVFEFFKSASQYFLDMNINEIGGVKLGGDNAYTIGNLSKLLSRDYEGFRKDLLDSEEVPDLNKLRQDKHNNIDLRDLEKIQVFLNNWNHPIARWLASGRNAASQLEKIRVLRNRASHAVPFYKWQFSFLWELLIGEKSQYGMLTQIYFDKDNIANKSHKILSSKTIFS